MDLLRGEVKVEYRIIPYAEFTWLEYSHETKKSLTLIVLSWVKECRHNIINIINPTNTTTIIRATQAIIVSHQKIRARATLFQLKIINLSVSVATLAHYD